MPRLVHVNLLDRERADFEAAFESIRKLDERAVAVAIPMGKEHEYAGVIDVLHMVAYPDPEGGREGDPQPIPDAYQAEARGVARAARGAHLGVVRRADREVPGGRGADAPRRSRRR